MPEAFLHCSQSENIHWSAACASCQSRQFRLSSHCASHRGSLRLHLMLVSNCRWEVGDVSTLNIGETVVSYQTMKYKFNYTPLVKFLNFIVWYDTMKTSTLERQSISICSRQGHALIPPPSRVIFVSCQGEKEQLPTCSIIALSPNVTRL